MRLGAVVRRARLTAGLTVKQAASLGGISDKAWTRVEAGEGARNLTYAAIERGLQWVPGTCAQVVSGELDPELVGQPLRTLEVEGEGDDPHVRVAAATTQESFSAEEARALRVLAKLYLKLAEDDSGAEADTGR